LLARHALLSKVRALTRVARPENETELIAFALPTTVARVESRCRQLRNVLPESTAEAERRYRQRSLRVFRDAGRGTMTFTLEIPVEQGEQICRALGKAVADQPDAGPEHADLTWQAQQADAVVTLAKAYLAGGEGASDLPVESVRRLGCDGSVVHIADGADGAPLSVGRRQRTVSPAIRRALWARDGGCDFPGCAHARFVDAQSRAVLGARRGDEPREHDAPVHGASPARARRRLPDRAGLSGSVAFFAARTGATRRIPPRRRRRNGSSNASVRVHARAGDSRTRQLRSALSNAGERQQPQHRTFHRALGLSIRRHPVPIASSASQHRATSVTDRYRPEAVARGDATLVNYRRAVA
jgi:hypothetical protein